MKKSACHLVIVALILVLAQVTTAVPPSPEAVEKFKAEGRWEEVVAQRRAFEAANESFTSGPSPYDKTKDRWNSTLAASDPNFTDTARVLVILVDFNDNPSTGGAVSSTPNQWDSVLFSHPDTHPSNMLNPTGSMTQYYMEISYGSFFIIGDIVGWYRMAQDYEWFVGEDDGGTNGRVLAKYAAQRAEANGVDFSQYDNNEDGYCDGLIIIHAGPGAETGAYGIWSHKSSFDPQVFDGVVVSDYTMNPEEYGTEISPIGVFCHEYGHFLGLPDLYDIDYTPSSSDGVGYWSVMASGSYNGDSKSPAHMDAWCKYQVGFVSPTVVTQNLHQAELPSSAVNPQVYLLQNGDVSPQEYWLVENRQKQGFDYALPGSGLMIYHVDEGAPEHNQDYMRYHVAVEQADGNNDLALATNNKGDTGDPWPGYANARDFHDRSTPDSRANETGWAGGASTEIGVWNITDNDSVMYADLDVEWSRPWIELSDDMESVFDDSRVGDGDGQMEAGEEIDLTMWIKNYMRVGYNAYISVASNNPKVEILNGTEFLNLYMARFNINNPEPLTIWIAEDVEPMIDTLWFTVVSDSIDGVTGTEEYIQLIPLEVHLGGTQVLLVDDDANDSWNEDERIADVLYELSIPFEEWNVASAGSPTGAELAEYPMVFWFTGDSTAGIAINADEMAAMKAYMDGGGNMLLSGGAATIACDALDADFLSDYFGAERTGGTGFYPVTYGFADDPVADGDKYRYPGFAPTHVVQILNPVENGQAAFYLPSGTDDVVGVTNVDTGSHSTVLMTWPVEYIGDGFSGYGDMIDFFSSVYAFFNDFMGSPTDVTSGGGDKGALPESFVLQQNYPNPFNPTTTISYTLRPTEGAPPRTKLQVFNALGQKVTTLVDEVQSPGEYTVVWDGSTDSGHRTASGVYFYRLSRGGDIHTKKMVLLK